MKKRIMAALLAVMLVIGLVPVNSIFADSQPLSRGTGNLVAEFDADTISVSDDYKTSTLKIYYDARDIKFTTAAGSVDWSELGRMTESISFGNTMNGAVTLNTDGREDEFFEDVAGAELGHYSTRFQFNKAASTVAGSSSKAFLTMEFVFNGTLQPGTYHIPVTIMEVGDGGDLFIKRNTGNDVVLDAVLKVTDENGDIPTEPVTYTIQKDTVVNGTIRGASSAQEGENVQLTMEPETGYQVKAGSVSCIAEDGTIIAIAPVETGSNVYTFSMPGQGVTVSVEFEQIPEDPDKSYALTVQAGAHGTAHLNNVTSCIAGEAVTVYVKPEAGYKTAEVKAAGTHASAITVTKFEGHTGPNGEELWQFTMPEEEVNISVKFTVAETQPEDPEGPVTPGMVHIKGNVISGEANALEGARVVLHCEGNNNVADVTKVTDAEGNYDFGEVDGSYTYTVKAFYDTNVKEGINIGNIAGQWICESEAKTVTGSELKGKWAIQTLSVALWYPWDADGVAGDEKIYAGTDDKFLTTDDYYEKEVGGIKVRIYPEGAGDKNMKTVKAHYYWDVDGDKNVKEPVYLGEGTTAGTTNNYYYVDADFANNNPQIPDDKTTVVFIGRDGIPATEDDYYEQDVNNDGEKETIYAGSDKMIPGSNNYYIVREGTDTSLKLFAGEDKTAGTADDYYQLDVNKDGTMETIFVGDDRMDVKNPAASADDDYYLIDVDGRTNVEIHAGIDKDFNTADDWYAGKVEAETGDTVKVFPTLTDTEKVVYTFGNPTDHYDWSIGGNAITVRVGADTKCGTKDDEYDWRTHTYGIDEDVAIIVIAGSGKAGSEDKGIEGDYYMLDVNGDGEAEKVFVGKDGIPATEDDFYVHDVPGGVEGEWIFASDDKVLGSPEDFYKYEIHGTKENVFVGEDRIPGTNDDYYIKDVNGDGEPEKIFIGTPETGDKTPGTADDWYAKDIDGDGKDEIIVANGDKNGNGEDADKTIGTEDDKYKYDVDHTEEGEDIRDVFVGEDTIPGTDDDYYLHDVDGKEPPEKIFIGEDGIPGTKDDVYPYDTDHNKETEDIDVSVGEDGKPGTEDDTYVTDVDGDGEDETVHVGPDGIPGTDDDFYWKHNENCGCIKDTDGDGVADTECPCKPGAEDNVCDCWTKVIAGDKDHDGDNTSGTKDDWYMKDVDNDGEDEKVYIGDDRKPGTEDDFYYADVRFDANGGTLNGAAKILTVDITALPTASRSGYRFNGWTAAQNSGSALTLEQVKALKVDTTLYASWSHVYSGGGGGGGGSYTRPTTPITEPETPMEESPVLEAVAKLFNLDHIAYIVGFEDGNVRADANMTRSEAAAVFYRLLNAETRKTYSTNKHEFTDIPEGAWYETAAATLSNMGLMVGYGKGRFGGNDYITRAEFAAICARVGGFTEKVNYTFVDVPESHWAHDAIAAVADAGWVVGYGDSTFGPEDNITRGAVVTMLNRILGRNDVNANSFKALMSDKDFVTWPDLTERHWAYFQMIEAGNGHDQKAAKDGSEQWTKLTKD